MRFRIFICFVLLVHVSFAQMYFPPLSDDEWETMEPDELGFCPDRIDSLYVLLEEKGSRSFILLKDGKIVLEQYFGSYTQDSLWYWASAAKSLSAYLVGCAQEDEILDIEDPTSNYLGIGWTSAEPDKEILIKVRNQISMSTGLADNYLFPNCLFPICLDYMVDEGERWSYYNAPYRLTVDVLEEASGQDISSYTWDRLGSRIGMGGFWFEYMRYGTARDMARFGLLALNEGKWDTDTILGDEEYLFDMVHPSQDHNPAYGYLWWLNGSEVFMAPGTQILWPGKLIPNAPDDTFSALGKNDQKIYVVPSEGYVIVRQGEDAGQSLAGPSSFDNDLWEKINDLTCLASTISELKQEKLKLYPNPAKDHAYIDHIGAGRFDIIDLFGRVVESGALIEGKNIIELNRLDPGLFNLRVNTAAGITQTMLMKE